MIEIRDAIKIVVNDLFDIDVEPELTRPDEQFGDFATNVALQIAKQLGQNPREVAEKIAGAISANTIASTEVAGPGFINIRVSSATLREQLVRAIEQAPNEVYGSSLIGQGKTVVNEFPSPNMAKPFSVGHIRSALQGWSIYKLMALHGYTTITDNHVGDSGTPFGKWVVGFLKYSSDEQLHDNGINELSRIYIAITNDLKAEKEAGLNELADEVQAWLQKLEAKDPQAIEYSEKFNKISFDHMHHVMDRLRISTEFELGESYFVARGQEMADELLKKGIAEESDGAIIVKLEEYGIKTPVMLRKANGTSLYATTDLATIEYREQNWQPEKVFIHTGQEQAFYFRQLNALAEKAGFKPVIVHLWHGLVDQKSEDGKREKMSSRKGVVLLEEFLDHAEQKAAEYSKEGSREDVLYVALGAVKFADFVADRKNGVLFDWDNMFSVQGYSGPAVQYATVRIKSILEKTDTTVTDFTEYEWHDEHRLLLRLLEYPALLRELHDTYEMHKLATFLYDLARTFNRYYEEHRIGDAPEPERSAKIWLIGVVQGVLVSGLDILGIQAPDRM